MVNSIIAPELCLVRIHENISILQSVKKWKWRDGKFRDCKLKKGDNYLLI